jgi:hypothetical protein
VASTNTADPRCSAHFGYRSAPSGCIKWVELSRPMVVKRTAGIGAELP